MSRYPKREVALIAELLTDKLIDTYQGEQITAIVDGFTSAGFTKTALEQTPAKLFQMLVTAAYDRRPFTGAAGGFEVIWGMRPGAQSIPMFSSQIDRDYQHSVQIHEAGPNVERT